MDIFPVVWNKNIAMKFDVIRQDISEQNQQVLDIYQMQILNIYDKLINEEGIMEWLHALGSGGFMIYIEQIGSQYKFYGCNEKIMKKRHRHYSTDFYDVHEIFDTYVINYCRKILTSWHKKTGIRHESRDWRNPGPMIHIALNKKQRGLLTKILKIDNHRKMLRKQLSHR